MSTSLTIWTHSRGGDPRVRNAAAASLALHGLFALWLWWMPGKPPKAEVQPISVQLVSRGEGPSQPAAADAEPVAAPSPAPRPRPRPSPAPAAPRGERPPPAPPAPVSTPAPVPAPERPLSFAEWQRARRQGLLMPSDGGRGGTDDADRFGRDRCEPARVPDVVYLLYDASGSMADVRRAQGIHCARQYARNAIARGAEVVVGSFGRNTALSRPTRDLADVDVGLRAMVDTTGTILPSRELYPWFEQRAGSVADLVIISDGYIPPSREVQGAYRYFLELNPENRGVMYTVGAPGHHEIVGLLRDLGFDVFVFQELKGN